MLLEKIDNFDIFRPKMDSTKEVLHAIATFTVEISPAFPYVNAELGGWDYDQTNQVPGKTPKLQAYLESFGWRALDADLEQGELWLSVK